jgi:hypothetical protein
MLCKYKDYLGIPGEKIHTHFLGIAMMDVLFTIIGAKFISYCFDVNFIVVLIALFLTGIVLHRIFCVRTTVDKLLFPNL